MKPERVGDRSSFLSRFFSSTPPEVKEEGLALAADKAIELFTSKVPTQLLGLIFENEPLPRVVRLSWEPRSPIIETACNCNELSQWKLCRHVWAMLAAIGGSDLRARFPQNSLHLRGSHFSSDDAQKWLTELLEISPRWQRSGQDLLEGSRPKAGKISGREPNAEPPAWQTSLKKLQPRPETRSPAKKRRLYYSLDTYNRYYSAYELSFWIVEEKQSGGWGILKSAPVSSNELGDLEPSERLLLRQLVRANPDTWNRGTFHLRNVSVAPEILGLLLPALAATGRFGRVDTRSREFEALTFDAGGPWDLVFEGRDENGDLSLQGRLRRGETESLALTSVDLLPGGFFRRGAVLGQVEASVSDAWLAALRAAPPVVVPAGEVEDALSLLGETVEAPTVELDAGWQERIEAGSPRPALRLQQAPDRIAARLFFLYGATEIAPDDPREILRPEGQDRWMRRARPAENELAARLPFPLDERGIGEPPPPEALASLLETLAAEGWLIGVGRQEVRTGGSFRLRVESGIDWFDVGGELAFDDQQIELPSLLKAAREGRPWVNLADGTVGLLPPGWAARWASLIQLGKDKNSLRFGTSQALVLDHLLRQITEGNEEAAAETAPVAVEVDAIFTRVRERLRSFSRLEPVQEPEGFLGELRPYQRLGLAWLELLADLQLGGCLADDMGLGKTVQILAFLLARKRRGVADGKPSLLVVPRSLVFNWVAELQRFTPELSFHVSHGTTRAEGFEKIPASDLVITTYGTLVRDVARLQSIDFDVLLVDEAQAIKNRNTQAAEACRALKAKQRVALTGTPVENHLGELWSIFEFLNPGLLGKLPRISQYAGRQQLPPAALAEVAQALRPLILRRKKADVLQDLPAKTEQTLTCELGPSERKKYNELRRFYQASLQKKIAEVGIDKAKIWVLEALLRLRQAACHPGLIDKKARNQSSAKIDLLLENLEQILEEGHKALVFSQFTSLLDLVRKALDARGWRYEYLDGQTRDREARVQSFQTDPEMRLFLISLKAGGVGLNLTAASYVFLLDPWWNPAVEAQAIDRTHRIGQEQPVFAYRIIAEDTVEEKILKLQDDKRALADAIVAEDQRVLKQLTAADLENLLG